MRNLLALAVAALALVTGCAGSVRTTPSAAVPTATLAAPSATEAGVAGAQRVPSRGGLLEPGRYFVPRGAWTPATFSFTVPAGWTAENLGQTISKNPNVEGREVGWSVSIVDRLFAEPCGADDALEVGPTAADLASALVALPGVDLLESMDVTVDERTGKRLTLTAEAGIEEADCDPPIGLQIWLDRSGNKYFVLGPGRSTWVTMVDHEEGRFVIVWGANPTAAPEDLAELIAIIDSIRFET